MNGLFSGCSKLTHIDLSSFDTKNVSNMNGIFSGCSKLTTIDLSSFDTKNVTDMNDIIFGCSNLKKIKINNINSNDRLLKELSSHNIKIIDILGNNIKY
jgi:surface protein